MLYALPCGACLCQKISHIFLNHPDGFTVHCSSLPIAAPLHHHLFEWPCPPAYSELRAYNARIVQTFASQSAAYWAMSAAPSPALLPQAQDWSTRAKEQASGLSDRPCLHNEVGEAKPEQAKDQHEQPTTDLPSSLATRTCKIELPPWQ